jgi:uncharacterized membrane protein (UPF0127 family)
MVSIRDATLGLPVAEHGIWARSLWARMRGLMFRRSIGRGEALVIRPCSSIHMMFMRFPIDAVFFDGEGRVTRVARGVRPWVGLAFGGRGAKGVIELPAGSAENVEPGHQLEFTE